MDNEDDKIRVICDSTSTRRKIAIENFEKVKPFLDEGLIYSTACYRAGLVKDLAGGWRRYAWFKDMLEYGESQGYDYRTYSGKGGGRRK